VKFSLNTLLPNLRVHSWGGLGSQLFAAHIALRLKQQYPGRRVTVIVHTSGVTKRYTELNFARLGIEIIENDDYLQPRLKTTLETQLQVGRQSKYIKLLKAFLYNSKIVVAANSEYEYRSIKPWTTSVRGHYTQIALVDSIVQEIEVALFAELSNLSIVKSEVVLHYRLGDLLVLNEKNPIDPIRIEELITKFKVNPKQINVFSDSDSSRYQDFVSKSKVLSTLTPLNFDSLSVLRCAIDSDIFIGTNAKLSLWAAIFRSTIGCKITFLPTELRWAEQDGLRVEWY
jgi:hypothetical protein